MPKQKHAFLPQQTLLIAASTVILVVVVGMLQFMKMKNERSKPSEGESVVEMATLPKATLVPIDGTWKKEIIEKREISDVHGDVTNKISLQIPKTWILEKVNIRPKAEYSGLDCYDYQILDSKKISKITITLPCRYNLQNDEATIKIPTDTVIISLLHQQISDTLGSHDSYIVRFINKGNYQYSSIPLPTNKAIDLNADQIYQNIWIKLNGPWRFTFSSKKTHDQLSEDLQIADTVLSSITEEK